MCYLFDRPSAKRQAALFSVGVSVVTEGAESCSLTQGRHFSSAGGNYASPRRHPNTGRPPPVLSPTPPLFLPFVLVGGSLSSARPLLRRGAAEKPRGAAQQTINKFTRSQQAARASHPRKPPRWSEGGKILCVASSLSLRCAARVIEGSGGKNPSTDSPAARSPRRWISFRALNRFSISGRSYRRFKGKNKKKRSTGEASARKPTTASGNGRRHFGFPAWATFSRGFLAREQSSAMSGLHVRAPGLDLACLARFSAAAQPAEGRHGDGLRCARAIRARLHFTGSGFCSGQGGIGLLPIRGCTDRSGELTTRSIEAQSVGQRKQRPARLSTPPPGPRPRRDVLRPNLRKRTTGCT